VLQIWGWCLQKKWAFDFLILRGSILWT